MKYIVITGNPITGFKFYGPFKTREAAKKWQDGFMKAANATIAVLQEYTK